MRTELRLASGSIGLICLSALAAVIGCSASNDPGPGRAGNGGQSNSGSGGSGNGQSGGPSGMSGNTGMAASYGGSNNPAGAGGTTAAGSLGGATGTAGAGTQGGTTATGTAGSTGTAGAGPVTCPNTDKTILTIDKTGWIDKACNNYGIQGAWYCYDDGTTQAGCTKNMVPYVADKGGMCLKGTTLGMSADWGAAIGLSLQDSGMMGTMAGVKSAYNAKANGVTGFKITVSGDTGGLPLRVNFPKVASPSGVSPFVELPGAPAAAPYNVMIADALVPKAWMVDNAGETADPTSIFDLQIQLPGDSAAKAFDFCITSIVPITDGSMMPMGGTLSTYGSAQCDNYAHINVPNYTVQNNAYNGNTHCVQAKTDNASKAGFIVSNLQANKPTGGAPGSYPSIVYGWHVDGKFYGGYTSPKTLSSITSIPTDIAVTVPGSGSYNASYDNWINSSPSAGSSAGTLEQMIWLNYRDTTPIGSKVATASLAGTTWDVWYGEHDGFKTVSYIRTNTTSMSFDINDFMKDTIQRGYAKSSDYLLGIQAGFEIWSGSGAGFSVDSFDVSVK